MPIGLDDPVALASGDPGKHQTLVFSSLAAYRADTQTQCHLQATILTVSMVGVVSRLVLIPLMIPAAVSGGHVCPAAGLALAGAADPRRSAGRHR